MMIAGHSFQHDIHGLTCSACARRFVDIAGTARSDIGKLGIAHTGNLSDVGFVEIRAEVERQWDPLVGIASGRGIGGMAPGEMEIENTP